MRDFGAYAIVVAIVLSVLCCANLALASETTSLTSNNTATISTAPVGNDLSLIDIGGFLRLAGGFLGIGNAAEGSGADTTPPTSPTNLTTVASSSSELDLSWTASTDNVGVVGYKILRAGVYVGTTTSGTTYADTGLTASTTYTYVVKAYDAANNVSSASNIATSTTLWAWPGQLGNPVGYAAHGPLGTTSWSGGGFSSGTTSSPTVYEDYVFTGNLTISCSYCNFISDDFSSGTGGVNVTGSNDTFTGDRFQSNAAGNYNVQTSGANLTFSYDSFTPLASFYTSPPGETWPSAGAEQNTTTQIADVNSINGSDGYQVGVAVSSGGPVTVDHSDFWGFGNSALQGLLGTTAQITFTNNWVHDAANANPESYHIDGIGYVNGTAGPDNVLIENNTIASIGNTNGIAFQEATSGYNNIQIIGNYLSGYGYNTALGRAGGGIGFTNSSFKNNVFGTDLQWVWGPLYADYTSDFSGNGNSWSGNTLAVISGTTKASGSSFSFSSANNGNYIWPDSSLHSTDFSP